METLPVTAAHLHKQPNAPWTLPLPWLIPGMCTGALLWACYFPLGWAPLAWFALVPLLSLVRLNVSKGRVFWGAFLAAQVCFWPALQWMRIADYRMYASWVFMALYCSCYFPVAIFLIRALDRRTRLPLMLSVPMVWIGLEYLRSFALTGFAWYYLGHTQHDYLHVIQIADLTGVYGISFLIAAVNAWLFECVWRFTTGSRSSPAVLVTQGLSLALLLSATWVYGGYRLGQDHLFTAGPRLSLIQGNHDQRLRNQVVGAGRMEAVAKMRTSYEDLCQKAFNQPNRPTLMVWPETSFPHGWIQLPADLNGVSQEDLNFSTLLYKRFEEYTLAWQASQLIGVNTEAIVPGGKNIKYNSALLYPLGPFDTARYDKIHRVPMGEYVPFKDWLPFMDRIAPYDYDYSVKAGEKMTRFTLGEFRFGVLICFEDSDPFLARAYGQPDDEGPAVDFLINISNDGWFDDTCEHEEHLAICRFRAIETRRAVARAVNMGISAVIDSNGRVQNPDLMPIYSDTPFWVVQPPEPRDRGNRAMFGHVPDLPVGEWAQYKNTSGVITATMPIDSRESFYVRFGDWLPLGCWIVVAMGLVGGRWSLLSPGKKVVDSADAPRED